MKDKKQIMKELVELRKKDLGLFRSGWESDEIEQRTEMPVDVIVQRIVDEYRKLDAWNSKAIDALKAELAERAKSQQCLADIVMRLDTVANKWQAALNEQARINEMLIKRVEAMEQRIEKHECTNPFTGDNMRSGIQLDPKTVQEAIANGFGSDEPPNETT